MDRARSDEIHINVYQTIRCHIPIDSNLNIVTGTYGSMLFFFVWHMKKILRSVRETSTSKLSLRKKGV